MIRTGLHSTLSNVLCTCKLRLWPGTAVNDEDVSVSKQSTIHLLYLGSTVKLKWSCDSVTGDHDTLTVMLYKNEEALSELSTKVYTWQIQASTDSRLAKNKTFI